MIFDNVDKGQMASIMKINSIADYPQIEGMLVPAAETAIASAVGAEWIAENEENPTAILLLCTLVASWLDNPEMLGEITPGCNFMLGQLKAEALGVDA